LIMDDKLDDVIPLVAPARAEHLKDYASIVNTELLHNAKEFVKFVEKRKTYSQKDFAFIVKRYPTQLHGFMFKARALEVCDVPSVVAMFKEFFKKTLTTQAKVDAWRNFLGSPKFEMKVD